MKSLSQFINENLNIVEAKKIVATDDTIYKIIKEELKRMGANADLNHIDVSKVTDMTRLFNAAAMPEWAGGVDISFSGDVSRWDVRNVKTMDNMFAGCHDFNCDISGWDVRNVENMDGMFHECRKFNCDLNGWNTASLVDAKDTFKNSGLEKNPPKWYTELQNNSLNNMTAKVSVYRPKNAEERKYIKAAKPIASKFSRLTGINISDNPDNVYCAWESGEFSEELKPGATAIVSFIVVAPAAEYAWSIKICPDTGLIGIMNDEGMNVDIKGKKIAFSRGDNFPLDCMYDLNKWTAINDLFTQLQYLG